MAASQKLTKPPLQPNLDNLKQGLVNNLKLTQSTEERVKAGWMPKACKDIANEEGKKPADFQVWKVKYNDDSPESFDALVKTFGRLPVHTRDYVRHVVSVPSAKDYAYNSDANVVFFGNTLNNLNVHLHESAHSLDIQKAYSDKQLSTSAKWLGAYRQDSAVPDPYSQTNQVENVAQNTVVASFQKNVPGGFSKLNPNANKIKNQYSTVIAEQKAGGDLLIPGGKCRKRLPNSESVPVGGTGQTLAAATIESIGDKPDMSIQDTTLEVLPDVPFDTREACNGTAFT
ncbi:MAG: hypothetical protein Q9200_005647 [Gallowayella weberi]